MPTDETVTASDATAPEAEGTTPEITDDLIKSHPVYKELEEKHSAARQGMDTANIEVKKLKKALVGDEEQKPSEPEPATKTDLQSMKDDIRWELKNEPQIELANKNGKYDEYVSQGKSKQDALKLALFDEGITNSASQAESMRQAAAASATPGVDRAGGGVDGVPEEMIAQYQKSFPKMKKEELAQIIKTSLSKQSNPDHRPAW